MPALNPNNTNQNSRATFRPPWVKDGPTPLPMPAAPWTARAREQNSAPKPSEIKVHKPILKKQTRVTTPADPRSQMNTQPTKENGQIMSNKLPQQSTQEKVVPIKIESTLRSEKEDIGSPTRIYNNVSKPPPSNQLRNNPADSGPVQNQQPSWRKERQQSTQNNPSKIIPQPTMDKNIPPKPPAPPMPPPPPPPGGDSQPEPFVRKPITKEKANKLEALRSRPRKRPDWSDMMKEVESGKKLKHVQCNDRSAPVIPQQKAKGQFVYESEKKPDDGHNKLLKQIQTGLKLKKVKCNDRSKPNLDGLRKFRRQMTVEEQIQKSVSMADIVAAAVQPDELDDIDKVRDDLQSAKQMLALELRNKEGIERENKRLAAKLANLEAELEKEKSARNTDSIKGQPVRTDDDEKLIIKLKEDAAEADRIAKDMEVKYHTTAEELDNMRRKLESAWLRNQQLEMQLKAAAQGAPIPAQLMKQPSSKRLVPSIANGGSIDLISDDDDGEDEEESETETEDESETDGAATQERQLAKEMKLLTNKLRTYREKQCASMKERRMLREQLTKRQNDLKEEKKKYKILQKEVDKMAKLMRETDDDDEEEDAEEEEEETESESESEESDEEEKSDEELGPGASLEDRRKNLQNRIKRHENRLSSLKKGNYLMKANIERLQDDLNKQREMSLTLQEDLNNILADLG